MEEENWFFGENTEKQKYLESEDNFDFNHTDKELLNKNIDDAVKELTDWLDSEPQSEIQLSDDEINDAIKRLLEKTHPAQAPSSPEKTGRIKKVSLRVLFVAAILLVLSVTCLFAVGNSRNVSIENGFMTFAKDTVRIVFFGEEKEDFITIDMLMDDLKAHGYDDVLFPQDFVIADKNYKVTVPEYIKDELGEQASFEISDENNSYAFVINVMDVSKTPVSYKNLYNAITVVSGDNEIYVFQFDDHSMAEFYNNDVFYSIKADIPLDDLVKIAESIK